jgi:predicted nucleic acid-binding Zn ribbon protein
MPKTEECDRCQRFSKHYGPAFLVCTLHPSGPAEIPCPDFAEVTEQLEPLGAYYAGRLILQPPVLTTSERLEILETHPFFTSICPTCGAGIADDGQMHCDRCGWVESSIASYKLPRMRGATELNFLNTGDISGRTP